MFRLPVRYDQSHKGEKPKTHPPPPVTLCSGMGAGCVRMPAFVYSLASPRARHGILQGVGVTVTVFVCPNTKSSSWNLLFKSASTNVCRCLRNTNKAPHNLTTPPSQPFRSPPHARRPYKPTFPAGFNTHTHKKKRNPLRRANETLAAHLGCKNHPDPSRSGGGCGSVG